MLLKIVLLMVCAAVCFANHTPKMAGKAIRPCYLNDYKCIRENLSLNSKCRNPRNQNLYQYTVPKQRFETPHFNASYIDYNLTITGQDKCFVSEFYFNLNSDTGVLGIDCRNLNFVSDRVLLQHWPLKEDTVYRYRINGTYPLIRMTMSMDKADALDMCNEFTFTWVDQLPIFNIVPYDLPTQEFLSTDLSMLNIFERETFFYRGNSLARKYLNNMLCDFGCN